MLTMRSRKSGLKLLKYKEIHPRGGDIRYSEGMPEKLNCCRVLTYTSMGYIMMLQIPCGGI